MKRGTILVRENDPAGDLYVLRKGMAMSYVLLDDGSRQILSFLFPADLLATAALVYPRSPETLVALGDGIVCPFDRNLLAGILAEHPRLAALMLALRQAERAAMTDRLAALGRTSARARVAGLLLDLRRRLTLTQEVRPDGSFSPGLTQEEIGDATGLTAVHVNRMLRQLEDERLIARESGRVRLLDEAVLTRSANYVDRFSGLNLDWLPPAR